MRLGYPAAARPAPLAAHPKYPREETALLLIVGVGAGSDQFQIFGLPPAQPISRSSCPASLNKVASSA